MFGYPYIFEGTRVPLTMEVFGLPRTGVQGFLALLESGAIWAKNR